MHQLAYTFGLTRPEILTSGGEEADAHPFGSPYEFEGVLIVVADCCRVWRFVIDAPLGGLSYLRIDWPVLEFKYSVSGASGDRQSKTLH